MTHKTQFLRRHNIRERSLSLEEISAITKKAEGNKCPVCWKISKIKCERHSN